ncbi:E domain-containing protein, partial [Staphylococcus gallinarum]|uniref:E domain-containing protein n=1 Tax=Staphylococcus gallinarum TaxID=1293 RepID=UPI0015FBE2C6
VKKREFNPNLNAGEEKVIQVGQPGEKTITTPITINPVTGEKVGEGEPVESITKEPVDEITQYGGQKVPQGHKDEYDPNLPVGSTKDEPGQPGIKNPETGEVVTPPVDDVTKHGPKAGEPIVSKSEVPFEKKREFNPNLNPGEEKVTQVGQPGEKTITTPITINPVTGEKVGEGEPVESITKEPVDEITQYGGQKVPQGHKDEYDPNLPVGSTKEEPGQPGIKNPETGEVVTPPVDDVTKHGPKAGEPIITKEKIPFEKKREFNPNLNPGEEKVTQVGQPGEKTITTPITINPVTGEKVGEGDPVESITKEPVDEITQYGGQKVPQGHKDEYDPNLPVGTTKDEPGQPGIKNPETGEVVTPPVDDVTKHGPKAGEPIITKEKIPFEKKREFNPNLNAGEEKVTQVGQPGEKTITTPITINPVTGEKVGEGDPVESITKEPVDEITQYGGQKVPQGHKDEYDPNLPVGSTKEEPGQPGIKNPETGEVVTPPVDDVTKHGPKAGEPIVTKEKIPFKKKRVFNPFLKPGSPDKVVQKGKIGERTITTPITINPVTGEKVSEGNPVESITKVPVDEIINYGPEVIPHITCEEDDPNLPKGETKIIPGKDGLKDPETGEIIEKPRDEVIINGSSVDENSSNGPHSSNESNSDLDNKSNDNTGSEVAPNNRVSVGTNSKQDDTFKNNEQNNNHKANGKLDSKALPDTGETTSDNSTMFGSLFAALGSVLLFRRNNKKSADK